MQGVETTAFTLDFFILQAVVVFFAAWLFIFFIIRNKRRRNAPFNGFKRILKQCSRDAKLDSLVNNYTDSALKYMEFLASPENAADNKDELLEALNCLNEYLISKDEKIFIEPSLSEQTKLYKSALLMKNIYHVNVK